ncbi:uncharacterized protein LOC141673602 [Apium graveolens]|uniref:uncharacterized protein LOC141673602 n=1 Tax=Apium graveolens TaxID=4045 RepID=UPI003D7B12EC
MPKKQDSDSQTINEVIQIDPSRIIDISREPSFSPVGEMVDVSIDEIFSDKTVKVGKDLSTQIKDELTRLLQEFSDIFAWSPSDMPGIPTDVARHSLHVDRQKNHVKQKRRTFSEEKRRAIDEELDRLLLSRFIGPVKYPTWIANVVLVKKSNGKWRMCVDHFNLNRACPKDYYPLPNIDQLIDAMAGHELLPFMDAFSGYNQIRMDDQDLEQIAFITHRGVFAYRNMPFRLINAGRAFGASYHKALKVYISASDGSVASILVKDVEGHESPVYYVSHTLKDAETRYPHVEKLVYALVIASRKLRHYFQGRLIKVMTDQPLKRIMHKSDMTGRLAAWTVWTLYVDGSSISSSGGAGVILISPEGFKIQQALKFSFPVINNVAEYEALLTGLRLAIKLEVNILEIFGDSKLVTKQLHGEFKAHDARMLTYLKLAMSLLEKVQSWIIKYIYREDNQWADAVSKLASSVVATSEAIYIEERRVPSVDMGPLFPDMLKVNEIFSIKDWHRPILEYILQNKLPQDKGEARSISYKAKNYCVLEIKLYRRGLVEPLLRCLGPEETETLMVEFHTGICGDHLGCKNLALKIMRQGLFWPTMRGDFENFVRKCKSCQLYGSVSHQPSVEMIPVVNPCPFFQWGIDIVGPFPKSKNQAQYIVVAVDYATEMCIRNML